MGSPAHARVERVDLRQDSRLAGRQRHDRRVVATDVRPDPIVVAVGGCRVGIGDRLSLAGCPVIVPRRHRRGVQHIVEIGTCRIQPVRRPVQKRPERRHGGRIIGLVAAVQARLHAAAPALRAEIGRVVAAGLQPGGPGLADIVGRDKGRDGDRQVGAGVTVAVQDVDHVPRRGLGRLDTAVQVHRPGKVERDRQFHAVDRACRFRRGAHRHRPGPQHGDQRRGHKGGGFHAHHPGCVVGRDHRGHARRAQEAGIVGAVVAAEIGPEQRRGIRLGGGLAALAGRGQHGGIHGLLQARLHQENARRVHRQTGKPGQRHG